MMRPLKMNQTITVRESRSLAKYLTEISKVDLLSAEEEAELAKRIRNGDEEAIQRLVQANLRFVVSVAKQYRDSYLSLNDLINEGNLGLVMAAHKFDETKGFKFISYAIWWIRQSILKAISEQSRLIRLPLNRITALNKLNRSFTYLEQKFGRGPTADELAEETNLNFDEIDVAMKSAPKHISIDEPLNEEEEISLHDILEDTEQSTYNTEMAYADSLKIDTARVVGTLPKKQKEVIEMYFGLGNGQNMTLEDIADKFGLNRERIRQIKEQALRKIRTSSSANGSMLREYLCH